MTLNNTYHATRGLVAIADAIYREIDAQIGGGL